MNESSQLAGEWNWTRGSNSVKPPFLLVGHVMFSNKLMVGEREMDMRERVCVFVCVSFTS